MSSWQITSMFFCCSLFYFGFLSLLGHVINSFFNQYILLRCDLRLSFWTVFFVHSRHLEDAVDIDDNGYFTLRTIWHAGDAKQVASLALRSHIRVSGC